MSIALEGFASRIARRICVVVCWLTVDLRYGRWTEATLADLDRTRKAYEAVEHFTWDETPWAWGEWTRRT